MDIWLVRLWQDKVIVYHIASGEDGNAQVLEVGEKIDQMCRFDWVTK